MQKRERKRLDLIGSKVDKSPDWAGATTTKCGSALVLSGLAEGKCWPRGGWWVVSQNSLVVCLIWCNCGLNFACKGKGSSEGWRWRHPILFTVCWCLGYWDKLMFQGEWRYFSKHVILSEGSHFCSYVLDRFIYALVYYYFEPIKNERISVSDT